ncbi:hypothetical protein K488DRAFT_80113 [Vararia minispora EC-137]|uniref:Uncharacterized protein n=1 Tax=Vararia minispora EC-137 TaxID=1314806 RepID=A0ACB8QD81_9AGAM|nr:hypothetical protein K488DRAFT_80113 [Vararia minispora EC-137]
MHAVARRLASAIRRASTTYTRSQNAAAVARARCLHVRRQLPYIIDDGMGRFLSPEGLRSIAVEYQQGLIDRLNDEIRDTRFFNRPVAQIVIESALDPKAGLTFNYASEALNNDFFLHCLPPVDGRPNHEDAVITDKLGLTINAQYGTLGHLKTAFSAAAMGMFSSGWVWCVCDPRGNLGIIATYGAGTLLVSDRQQRFDPSYKFELGGKYDGLGPSDKAEAFAFSRDVEPPSEPHSANPYAPLTGAPASSPTSGVTRTPPPITPSTPSRALHTTTRLLKSPVRGPSAHSDPRSLFNAHRQGTGATAVAEQSERNVTTDFKTLGDVLYPLFCVPTSAHAWMGAGYGVWGKERFLANFWDVLDWERVTTVYQAVAPDSIQNTHRTGGGSWVA